MIFIIYIQLNEEIVYLKTCDVHLKDIAVYTTDVSLENIVFAKINKKNPIYAMSNIDILKKIKEKYPNQDITFFGCQNVCVEYIEDKKQNKLLEYLKVFFVSTTVFIGSATALMAFQIESNIDDLVFEYAKIFGVSTKSSELGFAFAYSSGITIGIILFFNRFGKTKITKDPTPIELEMNEFNNKIKENITQSFLNSGEESEGN